MSEEIHATIDDIGHVHCLKTDCLYHSMKCGKGTATCELKTIYIDADGKCNFKPDSTAPDFYDTTLKAFRKAVAHFSKAPDAVSGKDRVECLRIRKLRDDNKRLVEVLRERCELCGDRENCPNCRIDFVLKLIEHDGK